jgi:hypothetical protein
MRLQEGLTVSAGLPPHFVIGERLVQVEDLVDLAQAGPVRLGSTGSVLRPVLTEPSPPLES